MTIRIVNDRQPGHLTRILDADTGEDLTARLHCTRVDLTLAAGAVPVARLTSLLPQIEITVEEAQRTQVCPYCGQQRASVLRSANDLEEPPAEQETKL